MLVQFLASAASLSCFIILYFWASLLKLTKDFVFFLSSIRQSSLSIGTILCLGCKFELFYHPPPTFVQTLDRLLKLQLLKMQTKHLPISDWKDLMHLLWSWWDAKLDLAFNQIKILKKRWNGQSAPIRKHLKLFQFRCQQRVIEQFFLSFRMQQFKTLTWSQTFEKWN